MNNQLNRRIQQLEEKIGLGKSKKQYALYIEIAPSLEDAEVEETPQRIHLGGRLWATALEGSAFSPEQISSLKAEYSRLTPEQIAAQEQNPPDFHSHMVERLPITNKRRRQACVIAMATLSRGGK